MEAAVWTDPQVADMLMNDYVLVSLYVDDKTPLPEPVEVADARVNSWRQVVAMTRMWQPL